ncbi:alanine--tRNA ligase [Methanosarcinales archaeon]|nr:MAG: alanine--tRNA ligase [Methanosarcinales archaeon]
MDDEYDLNYFKEHDFVRKKCSKCGKFFWTQDEKRKTCGDAPCDPYSFIDNPMFSKPFTISEMREYYLSFFEKKNHKRIERYPVVARWRDDIYLTIASIADFQPFVTSGLVPPPANPLTISQPCIRLDDLDSVGMSGRHLTLFEMMAHHAFNYPENEIYWKEETVALCDELLKSLGIRKGEVTYKEEPWAGGGNAGPCLEVLVGGLEIATLVFMNLEVHPHGDIVIKGEKYRRMKNYIVDTGYGLERMVWASQGCSTIYEATFPHVLEKVAEYAGLELERAEEITSMSARLAGSMDLSGRIELTKLRKNIASEIGIDVEELEKILRPIELANAISDHTRCLAFMLGDGIVPSNVKEGYLARLVIRRTLRMMKELGISVPLYEIVDLHLLSLKDFPELLEMRDIVLEVLYREEEKYKETIERGRGMLRRMLKKDTRIGTEKLIDMYDTHGIPPEIVSEVANEYDVVVEVPANFYSLVAERHSREKMEIKVFEHIDRIRGLPSTKRTYYERPNDYEFESEVLDSFDKYVVLEHTLFYPEGGGQPADHGTLRWDGGKCEVVDVQMYENVIVHTVSGEIPPKGTVVKGVVNRERRIALSRHHTATHIVNWAAKQVLGKHVWQAGAQKLEDRARLDISHYKRISEEELLEIEKLANEIVMEDRGVEIFWMGRTEAEKMFGFSIYQGGVPPGEKIRIVKVGDDVEACGGIHCEETGRIGPIKMIRSERIQDGVERLEFSAGMAAINEIQRRDTILQRTSRVFSVPIDVLEQTANRFFEEWKELRKEVKRLKEEIAELKSKLKSPEIEKVGGVKLYVGIEDTADMQEMIKMATKLANENKVVACEIGKDGKTVIASPRDTINASMLMRELAKRFGGGGGGNETLAQGKLNMIPSVDEVKDVIRTLLGR